MLLFPSNLKRNLPHETKSRQTPLAPTRSGPQAPQSASPKEGGSPPPRSELEEAAPPSREGRQEGLGQAPSQQEAGSPKGEARGPSTSWCTLPPGAVKDGVTVQNLSRYDTTDIGRFVKRGVAAYGDKAQQKRLLVVVRPAPGRTRGCARLGGDAMVLAVARPSKWSTRKAALILRHEVAHLRGADHHEMSEDVLWSRGPLPRWTGRKKDPPKRKRKKPSTR